MFHAILANKSQPPGHGGAFGAFGACLSAACCLQRLRQRPPVAPGAPGPPAAAALGAQRGDVQRGHRLLRNVGGGPSGIQWLRVQPFEPKNI